MLINIVTKVGPNIIHMKGNALQLFGEFHHSNIIFLVVNSLWLLITTQVKARYGG